MTFNSVISGYTGQLLTIMRIFSPRLLNLPSSSCNHSSKIVSFIHTLFCAIYRQRISQTCLKHLGLADFPTINIKILSLIALRTAMPTICALLCCHMSNITLGNIKFDVSFKSLWNRRNLSVL